ncbi:MAG: TetR/AcrR family transcriptional regulator [Clostridia bacterium]|nr:TetR/AcrR family transcriptional regulator [Clostridia bacterium]
MNKREKQKQERQQVMIEAARSVFQAQGIETTKMTDIAECAGIGVASLYRYFKTKIELALAVGEMYWSNIKTYLDDVSNENLSGLEALEALMIIYKTDDVYIQGFFTFLEQLDAFIMKTEIDKEALKSYEASVESLEPLFETLLTKGQKDGSIRKDIDVHKYYLMISHSLAALKQKHCSRGIVLSTDNETFMAMEMDFIINIFISYLKG